MPSSGLYGDEPIREQIASDYSGEAAARMDSLDLDQYVPREGRNLHKAPRRLRITEEVPV